MSQPFRDGGLACPACNVSLRELGVASRLVCDHCGGMLLAIADFQSSLAGANGEIPKLVIEERTSRACPRCEKPLMSAEIVSGETALPYVVHACALDGVWLDGGTLEPMLEELGRSGHGFAGGVGGRGYGGVSGGAVAGVSGAAGSELPPPHGTVGTRTCPACAKPLVVEQLEGVTIDRCTDHGIWFDPTELETTLANAGESHRRGLRYWLRHLFE